MKRLKNKLVATTLFLASIFLFSSCDNDDYEWRAGEIYYEASFPVSSTGTFRNSFEIGYDWVEVISGGRYDRIDDIRYRLGRIEILRGSYIDNFTLRLSNSNVELPVRVRNNTGGILYDTDDQVWEFLNAIVEVIRRNGYAVVYIEGYADRGRVDLDFIIDVDAYVRY